LIVTERGGLYSGPPRFHVGGRRGTGGMDIFRCENALIVRVIEDFVPARM